MDELLYGQHAVAKIIKHAPERIKTLYCQADKKREYQDWCALFAADAGQTLHFMEKVQLDKRCQSTQHQGIAVVCTPTHYYHENDLENLISEIKGPAYVLILDSIQDPHNLGACLRTAEAAGVHFVVIPKDQAVAVTPVVHKASSGASVLMPIVRVTNLTRAINQLKDLGLWIIGTSLDGKQSLYDADLKGPIGFVLGNEGEGMRQQIAKSCDFLVTLPMLGQVESLNISVANGICLYEGLRQRRIIQEK